jgi:FkbM family methyltransferase
LDYESAAIQSFLRMIRLGDVVWDIGANIGIYTIMAGKRVGPAGQVVSWEPHPQTVEILKAHIRANGLQQRCQVHAAAVSENGSTTMSFSLESDPTTSRLLVGSPNQRQKTVVTLTKSLDEWRQECPRQPDLLKIDVEGAEALVLKGGRKLLSGTFGARPLILIAVHPQFLGEFGSSPPEIARFCKDGRYLSYDLQGKPAPPIEYAEYWLIPEESADSFRQALAFLHDR